MQSYNTRLLCTRFYFFPWINKPWTEEGYLPKKRKHICPSGPHLMIHPAFCKAVKSKLRKGVIRKILNFLPWGCLLARKKEWKKMLTSWRIDWDCFPLEGSSRLIWKVIIHHQDLTFKPLGMRNNRSERPIFFEIKEEVTWTLPTT